MLTKENILQIPEMKKQGATNGQIAKHFGVHVQTIVLWIKKLRQAGHEVEKKIGRPKIQL